MIKIALCGFMGCGKTTVADALSTHYKLEHIDTDNYIQSALGMSISQIFEKHGESYFRDLEHDAINTLTKQSGLVLSLGGGAAMFERNVKLLKQRGYLIVFLNTDYEIIKKRLCNDNTRPLLKSNDIDKLYQKRLPIYQSVCDIKIDCKNESGKEIADMITQILKKA